MEGTLFFRLTNSKDRRQAFWVEILEEEEKK
jgi:hypothetical protein